MEDLVAYKGEAILERSGLVQEKPATYIEQFDREIESYLAKLRDFEVRCTIPGADEVKLLNEITGLTESMLDTCSELERKVKDPLALRMPRSTFVRKHILFCQKAISSTGPGHGRTDTRGIT